MEPTFSVPEFLAESGRPASVAVTTPKGRPALAMMWFTVEDGRFWLHTPESDPVSSPYLLAASAGQTASLMVASFAPPDDIRQVRVSGTARLEPPDLDRVRRLYRRYVTTWTPVWDEQTASPRYHLWSVSPDSGMAVSYPQLRNSDPYRWNHPAGFHRL